MLCLAIRFGLSITICKVSFVLFATQNGKMLLVHWNFLPICFNGDSTFSVHEHLWSTTFICSGQTKWYRNHWEKEASEKNEIEIELRTAYTIFHRIVLCACIFLSVNFSSVSRFLSCICQYMFTSSHRLFTQPGSGMEQQILRNTL